MANFIRRRASLARRSTIAALAIAASLCLSFDARGQTQSVDTFESGVNLGGWTFEFFDLPTAITPTGGHRGAHVRLSFCCDSFAPGVHTVGASVFTGDYRAREITLLRVDVRVFALEPQLFPLSLRLATDAGTPLDPSDDFAAFLDGSGTHVLPPADSDPTTGVWRTFEFEVPAHSTSLPPGWQFHPADPLFGQVPPSADWNVLVRHVTRVSFEFGPATATWPVHFWDLAVDDVTIVEDPTWSFIGRPKSSAFGTPLLIGRGELSFSGANAVVLTSAAPTAPAVLLLGRAPLLVPYLGGVLVPDPIVVVPIGTNATGRAATTIFWPPGVPSGTELFLQAWIVDPTSTFGVCASNGLRGVSS